ncbi:MAG: hypothetical protein E6R08_09030 [Nevskiaceae bacterium]|nr:MAG: hypothetical protein E6R08_09030 [Nevskiaceae bacterium]
MTVAPRLDNLKTTYKRWLGKRHPAACATCALVWGNSGAPASFREYADRYPSLDRGAKRHLTQSWDPGLTLKQVATEAGCRLGVVQAAVDRGMLEAAEHYGQLYVTRTSATLWRKNGAPSGGSVRSWISLKGAEARYGFTARELRRYVRMGQLAHKVVIGEDGRSEAVMVSRRQCGLLRDRIGYTPDQAASRLKVEASELGKLLEGLEWQRTGKLIPFAVIKTAAKRLGDLTTRPSVASASSADWISAREASKLAGVSIATIGRWTSDGEVERRHQPRGWHYKALDVEQRSRTYWSEHADRPGCPEWLAAERRSKVRRQKGQKR